MPASADFQVISAALEIFLSFVQKSGCSDTETGCKST